MRQYNPWMILFSIHIPKCGGTSFTKILRYWFWPGFQGHYFDHESNRMPRRPQWFKTALHRVGIFPLCIHGHFEEECSIARTYPHAKQFITVIRDPLEMQLSLFFDHQRRLKEKGALYWKGKKVEIEYGGDIDAWVEQRHSYLLKFLPWEINIDNYKEVIDQNFVHVCVTDNFQHSIDILAKKLNKKSCVVPKLNKSPRTQLPSESSIKRFQEKHTLEYAIYEYACKINN